MPTERHELHCKTCHNYVQFTIDTSVDGDYYLFCPVCKREHCRVVYNHHIINHGGARTLGFPIDIDYYQVTTSKTPTTTTKQPYGHTW